jgi:hypothetical protein
MARGGAVWCGGGFRRGRGGSGTSGRRRTKGGGGGGAGEGEKRRETAEAGGGGRRPGEEGATEVGDDPDIRAPLAVREREGERRGTGRWWSGPRGPEEGSWAAAGSKKEKEKKCGPRVGFGVCLGFVFFKSFLT